jgi:hypothetical protein
MGDQTRATTPAIIINSGSTNAPGFELVVYESGTVESRWWPRRIPRESTEPQTTVTGAVPAALASRFFKNLNAARPLSQFRDRPGFKSASFGFSLRVRYRDEQTPDLASPLTDARLQTLAQDVRDIEQTLGRPSGM